MLYLIDENGRPVALLTMANGENAGVTEEQHVRLNNGNASAVECPEACPDQSLYAWVEGKWVFVGRDAGMINNLAASVRAERDARIEAVRWRIERHSDEIALGVDPTEPLEPLLTYVQALRDLTLQSGFPETVDWPEVPALPGA